MKKIFLFLALLAATSFAQSTYSVTMAKTYASAITDTIYFYAPAAKGGMLVFFRSQPAYTDTTIGTTPPTNVFTGSTIDLSTRRIAGTEANTYGKTKCPKCGTLNSMFRPLEVIKELPVWDAVKCFDCGYEYKHTEQEIMDKELSIEDAWIEAQAKKQWAEECGITENDNRAVYAESCGWPNDFKWFLKGVKFGESMSRFISK